jgi:hypothetical protein
MHLTVAQLVERKTFNLDVAGSIPARLHSLRMFTDLVFRIREHVKSEVPNDRLVASFGNKIRFPTNIIPTNQSHNQAILLFCTNAILKLISVVLLHL